MFGTENHMQVVSQILATLLKRLCSHRTKNEVCQPAQSVADLPPPIPLVKIRYEPFILRSILPTQAFEEWALP
jgi:hypothetical protein